MGLFWAFHLSFVPALVYAFVVYWLDHYEKEPRLLLGGVFAWGALVATVGAIVSQMVLGAGVQLLTGSVALEDTLGATVFAPVTEEALKGLAVLGVFVVFRREFDSVLDGIVYGGVTGLGFAATENVLYLMGAYQKEAMEGLLDLFFLRVVLGAWDHALYTALTGIGLAVSRLARTTAARLLAPVAGWTLAVFFHALHNALATYAGSGLPGDVFGGLLMFLTDWAGWAVMCLVILFAILHEGRLVHEHLKEEAEGGLLSLPQYHAASSVVSRNLARVRALFAGRYAATVLFYQLCAELAHKKHQRARLGEEYHAAEIATLQGKIAALSPVAQA